VDVESVPIGDDDGEDLDEPDDDDIAELEKQVTSASYNEKKRGVDDYDDEFEDDIYAGVVIPPPKRKSRSYVDEDNSYRDTFEDDYDVEASSDDGYDAEIEDDNIFDDDAVYEKRTSDFNSAGPRYGRRSSFDERRVIMDRIVDSLNMDDDYDDYDDYDEYDDYDDNYFEDSSVRRAPPRRGGYNGDVESFVYSYDDRNDEGGDPYWEDRFEDDENPDAGFIEDPPMMDSYEDEDTFGDDEADDDSFSDEHFVVSNPEGPPENFGSAVAAASAARTGWPVSDKAFMPKATQQANNQNPAMSVVSSGRQSPLNGDSAPTPSRSQETSLQGGMTSGTMLTPRIIRKNETPIAAASSHSEKMPSASNAENITSPSSTPVTNRAKVRPTIQPNSKGGVPPSFGSAVAEAASGLSGMGVNKPLQQQRNDEDIDFVDDAALRFYRRTSKR
jgi:hypothetical protein